MSLRRLFKWKETTNLPKALRYSLTSTWFRTEIVFEWWSSTPWLKIFNPTAGSHVSSSTPWISHLLRFEALLFAFFKLPIVFLHQFWRPGRGVKISQGVRVASLGNGGMESNQEVSEMNLNLNCGLSFSQKLRNIEWLHQIRRKKRESAASSLGNLRLSSYLVSNEDFHPGNVHLPPWRGTKKNGFHAFITHQGGETTHGGGESSWGSGDLNGCFQKVPRDDNPTSLNLRELGPIHHNEPICFFFCTNHIWPKISFKILLSWANVDTISAIFPSTTLVDIMTKLMERSFLANLYHHLIHIFAPTCPTSI